MIERGHEMARIRANCPHCGEVELVPDDLELHLIGAVDDAQPGSTYLFDCPSCFTEVVRDADTRIARLLSVGGVPTVPRSPSIPHPEDPPAGPALTVDDLLDLHRLLQRDDWFDLLSRTC